MKKIVSTLLAYCILVSPIGCTTTKYLSMDKARIIKADKNYLVLHTPLKLYKLDDYKFTGNTIEGKLNQYSSKNRKAKLHVYANINFDLSSDNKSSQNVTLKRQDVNYITYREANEGQTALLIGAGVLLGLFIVFLSSGGIGNTIDMGGF